MRQLIESLKRLFESGKIDEQKILDMLAKNTITAEEKDYILQK